MQFSGKTVIITGAGKGIGRAAALAMAAEGAKVVAISRTGADLQRLADEIGAKGIEADLSHPEEVRRALREAGSAEYLINNAGTNVLESVLDFTEEGYETVLGLNLRAPLIAAQEFARARIAAGGPGAIVNVTSIAGHRGFQDHLCYAASKAGLDGATRVLAKELGPYGIRVNAVAPTITLTELAAAAWSDPAKSQPMRIRHPLDRFAEVEEVARAVVMLLSDASSMVTGTILPVDGGFLAV